MSAHKKFKIGDRVRFTDQWIQAAHSYRTPEYKQKILARRGHIVGFGKTSPLMVRVQMDDRKSRESYHMDFLEVA